jgi:cytochrome b involved in lipid metabolism
VLLDEQLIKSKSKAEDSAGVVQPSGQKLISFEEVEKHNKEDDAWVIINVSFPGLGEVVAMG